MIRLKSVFLSLSLAVSLSGCGGGGDVSADVGAMSILPSSFNWIAVCPDSGGGGVAAAVSIHTINGGKPPFRLRSVVPGVEVGLADASNNFVGAPSNMFSNEGDLILSGKDPKFAIRSTLACGSDVGVTVLDYFSSPASVSITVGDS